MFDINDRSLIDETNKDVQDLLENALASLYETKNILRQWSRPFDLGLPKNFYAEEITLSSFEYGVYAICLKIDSLPGYGNPKYIGHGLYKSRIRKFISTLDKPENELRQDEHNGAMKARKEGVKPNDLCVLIYPCEDDIYSGILESKYITEYEPPWNDPKMAGT